MNTGWIAVDLDGTLAYYDKWRGIEHIGEPVPAMLKRVACWLENGMEVRIFTARACRTGEEGERARKVIEDWCVKHIGTRLPITNAKDFGMIECWDDRSVQVIPNTGIPIMDVTNLKDNY